MNDQEYMARVRTMEGRLYRVAQAILWRDADCADAIQEAVFKGWLKKDRLEEPRYLETWLIRILINQCRDMLRRRKREPLPLAGEVSREDRLCEDTHLRLALKQLPEKYRLPLLLPHLEGCSGMRNAGRHTVAEAEADCKRPCPVCLSRSGPALTPAPGELAAADALPVCYKAAGNHCHGAEECSGGAPDWDVPAGLVTVTG